MFTKARNLLGGSRSPKKDRERKIHEVDFSAADGGAEGAAGEGGASSAEGAEALKELASLEGLGDDKIWAKIRKFSDANVSEDDRILARKHIAALDKGLATRIIDLFSPQLDFADVQTRAIALRALGNFGPLASPFAAKVAALADQPHEEQQRAASECLGTMGKVGEKELLRLLASKNARASAAYELGRMGAQGCAVQVAALLTDPDTSVRGNAVRSLGRMGEAGYQHANGVGNLVADGEAEVRRLAAEFITQVCQEKGVGMEKRRDAAVNHIGVMIQHKEGNVRQIALKALSFMDLQARIQHLDAVGAMINNDTNPNCAKLATDIVTATCNQNTEIAIKMLDHADQDARRVATDAVCDLGKDAKAHSGVLARMINDEHPRTRQKAVTALGRMGEDKYAAEIAKLIEEEKDPTTRAAAIVCLINFGDEGRKFAAVILPVLQDPNEQTRTVAADALKQWASQDREKENSAKK